MLVRINSFCDTSKPKRQDCQSSEWELLWPHTLFATATEFSALATHSFALATHAFALATQALWFHKSKSHEKLKHRMSK
jgi:hypothetical protein